LLVSLVYVVVCRLLAFLVLLAREGCQNCVHSGRGPWGAETRSGGELVFVDEAAEEVAPAQGW
jgi:hypothetical protein